jgi:hypothetical protein
MDIDSGNALNAARVSEKTKMKTGENVEVDLEKAESRLGSLAESVIGGEGDVPLEPVFSRAKELPFSQARLVGLVVTLTGAAFLNVGQLNSYTMKILMDYRL